MLKYKSGVERLSCASLTLALTVPFVLVVFLLVNMVIPRHPPGYNDRVVYTSEFYVAGFSERKPLLCTAMGTGTRLVVLVMSSPQNALQRRAVRRTWGSYARGDVALAFVLGIVPPLYANDVTGEDFQYNDLIIGRFHDSYTNLTLKMMAMLEWIDSYCPYAHRFIKTDDDTFLNVPAWLDFAAEPSRKYATRTIWGLLFTKHKPVRNPNEKGFIPWNEFPEDIMPDYTAGVAYMMTSDCVRPLRLAALAAPYLRTEDVFITGVLADRLGIARRQAPYIFNELAEAFYSNSCAKELAVHKVHPGYVQFALWNRHKHCVRERTNGSS